MKTYSFIFFVIDSILVYNYRSLWISGDLMKEKKSKKLLWAILIEYASAAVSIILLMLYQDNFELLGLVQAVQVTGALLFIVGWFVYIYHQGLFDVLVYGVGSFFKGIFGRKMNRTIVEMREGREKMPRYLFLSLWINGVVLMIAGYLVYFIYLA